MQDQAFHGQMSRATLAIRKVFWLEAMMVTKELEKPTNELGIGKHLYSGVDRYIGTAQLEELHWSLNCVYGASFPPSLDESYLLLISFYIATQQPPAVCSIVQFLRYPELIQTKRMETESHRTTASEGSTVGSPAVFISFWVTKT